MSTVLLGIVCPAIAETIWDTDIVGNVTWATAGSPYLVTSSITIEPEGILTVRADVIVKMSSGRSIWVEGILDVQGTSGNPVVFTSYLDDEYGGTGGARKGDWGRIRIENSNNILENCLIRYGGSNGAIYIYNCNPIIRNNVIEQCHDHGIHCYNMTGGEIRGNTIQDCGTVSSEHGIYLDGSSPTIIDNEIINSFGCGIYVDDESTPTIQTNTITGSGEYAIALHDSVIPSIVGNVLSGNGHDAFRFDGVIQTNTTLIDIEGLGWPYVFESSLTIDPGVILTVPAGTVLRGHSSIWVEGILDVQGTSGNPVVFTSYLDDEYGGTGGARKGDWGRIRIENSNNILENCLIRYGGSNGAIYIYNCNPIIRNNVIEQCHDHGIHCYNMTGGEIRGNTIQDCGIVSSEHGIYLDGSSPTITNCIITNSSGYGIFESDISSDPSVTYCLFYNNQEGDYWDEDAYSYTGAYNINNNVSGASNNIDGDPLFVSASDYHLSGSSPCIDAGDPVGDYTGQTDIDGELRVLNDRVDIGADEFSGTGLSTGVLNGIIYDAITGEPIEGAEVSVPSQPSTLTNEFGEFSFSDLEPGETSISVSKNGYYTLTHPAVISYGSSTHLTLVMTLDTGGNLPAVVEVRGNYCGPGKHSYYLDGISLDENFVATIDWKTFTPDKVKWILPGQTIIDNITGDTVSRTFDVGNDFGAGQKLKVVAISSDLTESREYEVNFDVVPLPPVVNLIPSVYYEVVEFSDKIEYRILGLTNVKFDLATWDPTQVESSFPIFGGKEMKVGVDLGDGGPVSGSLSGTITSDGKAELFTVGWDEKNKRTIRQGVQCRKGIKLPFVEAKPSASLQFNFLWSKADNEWKPGGNLNLGCDFTYSSPQIPVGVILLIPIYVRAEIDLDLDLDVGVAGWDENGPQWSGTFQFEPLAKGILGAGISGVACVEGYLGGGFHAGVIFIPEFEWMDPYIILVGGVQATLGPFHANAELRYEWPDQQKAAMQSMSLNQLLRTQDYFLLTRDYLNYQQPQQTMIFAPGEPAPLAIQNEQVLESIVFPYSVPDVARADNDVIVVWIADDISRSLINRTELTYTKFTDGIRTTSAPIADDGTADLYPQLIALPGGDAVCIWQDADSVLSDSIDMNAFASHLDISVSIYDSITDTWSAPDKLTNNGIYDRSAKIAAENNNNMLSVWISNASNDTWGSSIATNDIIYSAYNGTVWTAPSVLSSGFGTVLDTVLAYDGTTGTYVFCTDADDNFDTPDDQELWSSTYSGGSWTTPIQLTSDPNTDANPQLIYDSFGTLYMAWLKDNDIHFTVGTDVSNSTIVASPGESMQSKDFDLIIGGNNQVALVWNDVSETYNDIFVSYYEPVTGVWSQPRQLTSDDAAERFISATFDPDDNLFCVYDKNHTEFEDQLVNVNGQDVTVQGVPKAGQSDLMYLTYELTTDLSITVEDVEVSPANPDPGTVATISSTVKNLGESPAENIEVAFYNGDPLSGGVLIDTIQTITGPMAGGEDDSVSVTWSVPDTESPITIYVVVDPNLVQEDRDLVNNSVNFQVLAPDITVSEVTIQRAGFNHIITARIANEGTIPCSNFEVSIKDPNDIELDGRHIFDLPPGTYNDISFNLSDLPFGVILASINVDETNSIDEFDEDNNIRTVRIENFAPGDFDVDEDVDALDLSVIAGEWLDSGDGLSADISPLFIGDGKVDLRDLAEFAEYWVEGNN